MIFAFTLGLITMVSETETVSGTQLTVTVPVPNGYTRQTAMDCGYCNWCGCITPQVPGNISDFARVCDTTPGCEGFNSNGWLKGCLPPRCPTASKGMEPGTPSDLYTKIGPPKPIPPPAPVPDWTDPFYPEEEKEEMATANVPVVVSVSSNGDDGGTCVLRPAPQSLGNTTASVGDLVFGNWTVLAIVDSEDTKTTKSAKTTKPTQSTSSTQSTQQPAYVVMERRWKRWSLVVSVTVAGDTKWDKSLRKPLGLLSLLRTARYNLSASDPAYFEKAVSDPDDYIAQRIAADSPNNEASYLTAAKFLPPVKDYVVIGDVRAPVKAVVTMDGKILRSDGNDFEPPMKRMVVRSESANSDTFANDSGVDDVDGVVDGDGIDIDGGDHVSSDGLQLSCVSSEVCRTPPRDRSYCYKGQCINPDTEATTLVFDAAAFLGFTPSQASNFSEQQTGVLGGSLRVASVGCFDNSSGSAVGFEMMTLGPLAFDNDTILVAVRAYSATATPNAPYTYLSVSLDRSPCRGLPNPAPYCATGVCCTITPDTFYEAVVDHAVVWANVFDGGMELVVPYAERRQVDMAQGVLVSTSTVYIGDRPNYGTGTYWQGSPPVHSMMDSAGIADSLPLTTLSMSTALLRWGLFDSAKAKIGLYFDTFIFANGTADMGHWKDVWRDEGDGVYNCTYPDSLADMGRLLELFTDTVRLTRDVQWYANHLNPALRIGAWLLKAREEAVGAFPPSDPRHGIIYGPGEHDTCEDGRKSASNPSGIPTPIVDGQYLQYYLSVSMQTWRGMIELGGLLTDYPTLPTPSGASGGSGRGSNGGPIAVPGNRTLAEFATLLRSEASAFKHDLDAVVAAGATTNATGAITFVPACVVPAGTKPTPYACMTCDTHSSYSNFRYYAEMLSSGALEVDVAAALMDFRETNGGTLSGMTRFTDHLDDMPALGYAASSLNADRIDQFLMLLYGHAANYQGRGSFFSDEQQSLQQDPHWPQWRASLGSLQASFCTPSQTLVASMTAMQAISWERDNATIWIARGSPRRWFVANNNESESQTETETHKETQVQTQTQTQMKTQTQTDHMDRKRATEANDADAVAPISESGAQLKINSTKSKNQTQKDSRVFSQATTFAVRNAPSRWGNITFSVTPLGGGKVSVDVAVDFSQPSGCGAVVHTPTLMVRVRGIDATSVLQSAIVTLPSPPSSPSTSPSTSTSASSSTQSSTSTDGAVVDCEIVGIRARDEIVVVAPTQAAVEAAAVKSCQIIATFSH